MSAEIRSLVIQGVACEKIKARARELGMTTLRESALRLLVQGSTSLQEVLLKTSLD